MHTHSPRMATEDRRRPTISASEGVDANGTSFEEAVEHSTTLVAQGDAVDLETVLEAWQSATDRLQKTHELLRLEVGRLSDELEAKNRELERRDRLADLGRMATLVAHEVRNGMMPITLYMSLLRRRLEADPETIDLIDKVQAGFTSLEVTVSDLLNFASDREPKRDQFDLLELLNEVAQSLEPQLRAQQIITKFNVDSGCFFEADRHMLTRLFLNVFLNALDVMPQGGEIQIDLERNEQADRKTWEVIVSDTGPGLSPEVVKRLFDPFFTTKSGGTGLGLAIVERVMESHQGEVYATNRIHGGASIHLVFQHDRVREERL